MTTYVAKPIKVKAVQWDNREITYVEVCALAAGLDGDHVTRRGSSIGNNDDRLYVMGCDGWRHVRASVWIVLDHGATHLRLMAHSEFKARYQEAK